MKWQRCVSVMVGPMLVLTASAAQGDVITQGDTTINMDFVTVGNAGNAADDTGYGSVDYDYRIGKYEVAANQWAAVIAADSNVGNPGSWTGSQPTAGTTWYEAAKFTNWLTTGDAGTGVYSFDDPAGVTIDRTDRNAGGVAYFLPSTDEWYKAAYYDGDSGVYYDYPTGSDSTPTPVDSGTGQGTAVYEQSSDQGPAVIDKAGGLSPYGTMGQGGNVWEWNETAGLSSIRGLRGGFWYSRSYYLLASNNYIGRGGAAEHFSIGFRVASVPEPGSLTLMLCGALGGLLYWWRRRK